jgi:hypothetical protein
MTLFDCYISSELLDSLEQQRFLFMALKQSVFAIVEIGIFGVDVVVSAVVAGVAVHVDHVPALESCALTKAFCCCNICQANWFLKSNNLLYVSNTYLSFVLAYCVVN